MVWLEFDISVTRPYAAYNSSIFIISYFLVSYVFHLISFVIILGLQYDSLVTRNGFVSLSTDSIFFSEEATPE